MLRGCVNMAGLKKFVNKKIRDASEKVPEIRTTHLAVLSKGFKVEVCARSHMDAAMRIGRFAAYERLKIQKGVYHG